MSTENRSRGEYREWLLREIDGTLSAERQVELERAIAEDPELAAFAARQRRLDGLLEGLAEPPADDDAEVRALAAIRARIELESGDTGGGRVLRRWPWTVRVAAAAVVVLAVTGLVELTGLVDLVGPGDAGRAATDERVATGGAPRAIADGASEDVPERAIDSLADVGSAEPSTTGPLATGPPATGPVSTSAADERIESAGDPVASANPDDDAATPSLVEVLAGLGLEEEAPGAGALAAVAPAGDARWAALRAIERALDDTTDASVARGALRVLGVHGDRLSARAVEDHLADPERSAEAFSALVALGPDGWSGLAAALGDPALFPGALDAWRAVGESLGRDGARAGDAARALGGACERLARRDARRADLLVATALLADLGDAGLAELLERVDSGDIGLGAAGPAIAPRHAAGLERVLADRPLTLAGVEFARAAAAEGLAPRLAAAASASTFDGRAVQALAELPGDAPGLALLDLRRIGRPSLQRVDQALAARDDAEGWERLASLVLADRERAVGLVDFLLGDPALAGSAALATLARSRELPSDLRLLAVGASDPRDAATDRALRALLRTAQPDDARLAAAALVALAGARGVDDAVALLPDRTGLRRDVRAALDRESTSGLVRIARELRPILPLTATDGDELP